MPPEQDSPVPQTDTKADNQPATEESTVQPITEADDAEVMRNLGISPEVAAQIAPPAEPEAAAEPEAEAEKPEAESEPVAAEKTEETEEEPEDEEEETEEVKAEHKPDGRDKRIKRLSRQKKDAQAEVERLKAELEAFHAEQEKSKPKDVVPTSQEKSELEVQLDKADEDIAWCERNPDGGTVENGEGKEVFLDAEQVSRLKRISERKVLELSPEIAIAKRDAKQAFQKQKADADNAARQMWPEMFDRGTKLYQDAQLTLRDVPALAQHPAANWLVGLGLYGLKVLQEQQAAKQKPNGQKPHRDISERAFEPRVPVAPHSANPPNRSERPSPTKNYDQAVERLQKQGGRENLVAALEAMDETQPKTNARGQRLVET